MDGPPAGTSARQLGGYVARIIAIETAVQRLNDEKGALYAEARACGFDKKTLRAVVARRRGRPQVATEGAELVDTYEASLRRGDLT